MPTTNQPGRPGIPVTFQLCVNCYKDEYHLFEMNYDELPVIVPGLRLVNIPGMPNVVGPVAEFDNTIVSLMFDGKTRRVLAQVHGVRYSTDTLDEVKRDLPAWQHIRQIPSTGVVDDSKFSG